MSKDKKAFMAHLKRVYKEDKDQNIKELRNELKKRHMEFYTRDDGKKTIAFVQRAGWRRGKSPRGREWSNYFKTWDDDEDDYHETLLVWTELFGTNPLGGADNIRDFVDEGEEDEEPSYIQ